MLITINCHNAHLFQTELEQMYALRHAVLVDGEGWEDLRSDDELERDRFDNEFTTYLVSISEDGGNVDGCVRFLPSNRPSLTSEVFSHLCNFNGIPTGEDVYDGSRIVVAPKIKGTGNPTTTTTKLFCGMMEFGIALKLRSITCVVAMKWLHYMRHWNWDITPLGLPDTRGDESMVALEIHPTQEMLDHFRTTRDYSERTLSNTDIGLIIANHRLMYGLGPVTQKAAKAA